MSWACSNRCSINHRGIFDACPVEGAAMICKRPPRLAGSIRYRFAQSRARGAGDIVAFGEKVRFHFLSPIMARRWLLTLKQCAEGLAASKLPVPLRESTS
jgi:hypothetical protein